MDRVFLDANVLFSAAYRAHSSLLRLWRLEDAQLLTSRYALDEARRNLNEQAQRDRLAELTAAIEVLSEPGPVELPEVQLPDKDKPILAAAAHMRATHLLTGDLKHFGPLFGTSIRGVRVLLPSEYLNQRGGEPLPGS